MPMILSGIQLDADTVGDLIELRAATYGSKALLHVGDDSITYAEADERSNRLADSLAARGVVKGDVVATFMYNSTDHLCVWFACAKLGAIWAPVNVSSIDRDLVYVLTDSTARVLILDDELLDVFLPVRGELSHLTLTAVRASTTSPGEGLLPFATLLEGSPVRPTVAVHPSDPMAIMYTGGSTGMPKGVLVPHLYYFANAIRYAFAAQPTPDDVHFGVGHLFHGGGQLIGVMGPLYAGMTTILARWFSASAYWDRARQHGATIIDPIGPIVSAVVLQPARTDDREHSVRIGVGVATGQIRREVRDEFERRFGVPLLEAYAQTETGTILTSETLADRRGSNGKPQAWVEMRIADEHGMPVASGVIGEITYRMNDPASFMIEYWRKPAETVAAWRDLWFHTGDLGYLDADGYLYFTGRQAHWIRRRGENISSFEIERTIEGHPDVTTCAAVGVPSELGDEEIKVYVQTSVAPGTLAERELVEFCAARLSYFKVPRYVEFVDEFPRSAAKQEIQRHLLRERGIGSTWDRESDPDAASIRPRRPASHGA